MSYGKHFMRTKHLIIVSLTLIKETDKQTDQILLLRRRSTGVMDNHWSPPVGHLEEGELLVAAAQRECFEETAIQVPVEAIKPLALMQFKQGMHVAFQAHLANLAADPVVQEPELSDQVCWCPISECPQPVVPWLATLLQQLNHPFAIIAPSLP